jgi:CotS family spore coat protein
MSHRKLILENTSVSRKEESMVKRVMSEYGLQVIDIFKARSAYKIVTLVGTYCLKRMSSGRYKAYNGNYLVEHLHINGFKKVASFIKTKDNHLYVKYGKYILYVTEWIDGEECNIHNFDEVLGSVKLLAEFHLYGNKIDTSKLKIKNNLKNWPKIFYKSLLDLEQYKIIIDRKKIKNEFDISFLKYIDRFYDRGLKTIDLLNKSDYYILSHSASKHKTICHDSFYYQNIIKMEQKYFLIDLDSIIIDLQVLDLGKFLRRLMSNSHYQWNFEKARAMIEEYNYIKPLTFEELEVMLAVIMFPHKFWKLGKKRYIKQKSWSERKYLHKLYKLINQWELEYKFYEQYLVYINSRSSNLID